MMATAWLLLWPLAGIAALAAASAVTLASYRRFARQARGPKSFALPADGPPTALDAAFAPLERAHPGQTGLRSVLANGDAFAVRSTSARQAGRSLDLMYFIWRTDRTGWRLLADLLDAADRGVRIRLLLDDVHVQGLDRTFLALNQHENIEVRLFNPTRNRGHILRRMVEMGLGLSRFNRRMHGKVWIADGRLALVGGRNIGDDYLARQPLGTHAARDADVLLAGPAVAEVSAVFDSYWNMGLALPIVNLWPRFRLSMVAFRRRLLRKTTLSGGWPPDEESGQDDMARLTGGLEWTDGTLVMADPPGKAYGLANRPSMADSLGAVLAAAEREVTVITPYFVPDAKSLALLISLAERGVRVCLLTNALAATDMIAVHGAYRHFREPLLRAGVRIAEFAPPMPPGGKRDFLHAKVFLIDRKRAVVGSLNFDMRSAHTNIELGLLFGHPALLADLCAMAETCSAPDQSFHPVLEGGRLRWQVERPGLPAHMATEPEAKAPKRVLSWIVGHLPIQRYL